MDDFNLIKVQQDCMGVLARLVRGLDGFDYDAVLALVTPDCVWRGQTDAVGIEAIRRRLEARPLAVKTLHLLGNFIVDIESAVSVSVQSCVSVYRFPADHDEPFTPVPPLATLGRLHDRLVLTAEGWKVARRELTILASQA
ncbi:nuclear transport factor 2 family protein [Corticibacterium sp. UT-5YL-CI-8]|nr:nuclear transport factor 2 family protein [Tianweitania sp. UT-5YL-CI-8]